MPRPAEIEKQRTAPLRASVIVVVAARIDPAHPKIPEVEQIAAVAAATQNMLLAAHALGFAAKWATGKQAYDAGRQGGAGAGRGRPAARLSLPRQLRGRSRRRRRGGLDGVVAEWPPAAAG